MNGTQGLSRIVRGYRDRIQRGGGSVIVTAAGGITYAAAAGQSHAFTGGVTFANTVSLNGTATNVAGTLTVSGTGTHTFGGPVKVTPTVASNGAFQADTANGNQYVIVSSLSGAKRFLLQQATTTNDAVFFAVTGAAGSEVFTEAFRIVNANAYVSFPTRAGFGTAAPGYPVDVNGNARIVGNLGINVAPDGSARLQVVHGSTGSSAASFVQSAASATAPVVIVRLGGSPAAGGDAQQWQNSTPAVIARVTAAGLFGWIAGNTQTTVGAAGAAAALPAAPTGYAKIDVGGTAYAVPYYAAA